MQNFPSIVFIRTQAYKEIFKFALCTVWGFFLKVTSASVCKILVLNLFLEARPDTYLITCLNLAFEPTPGLFLKRNI